MQCPICEATITEAPSARYLPHFLRCPACTGFFLPEKPSPRYGEAYFSEDRQEQNKSFFSPLLDFFLWLRMKKITKILKGKQGSILDYGCGNGKLVAYLLRHGFTVEGYDPEPAAVTLAQKRGLPVFSALPQKRYDLIMLWHSLEHTATPLHDMRALHGSLTPHGQVLVAVPNGDSLEARFFGASWFCYDFPFHLIHFTPRSLIMLLTKVGFTQRSADYLNPEYTVSSLVQTVLNLFLPKNALYSFVSARRQTMGKGKLVTIGLCSLLVLIILSPIIVVFFVISFLLKRTASFIILAERNS